jgi:GntR family transcriptional regulator
MPSRRKQSPSRIAALERASEKPLYLQLAELLGADIATGRLAPGDRLPSESALVALHQVSRVTVRQALALLVRNAQVVPRRGKGTFVARPVVRHELGELQGFYDALRSQGLDPQTELLEFSPSAGRTDATLPHGLDLPVRLRRRYLLDGAPFAVVEGYLPAGAAGVGVERARRLTVYEILEQYLGVRVVHADVVIRCQRAAPAVARELGLDRRDSVLVMERRSSGRSGPVCEFMRIHIVPERYEFRIALPGPIEIASALRRTARAGAAAEAREAS